MPRNKHHRDRVYQVLGEPGPGALVAGYVRYSMELQDPASIATQKRKIEEFAARKGWKIVRWYEEPERSGKYEAIEQRAIFAELLADAGVEFTVVVCYANNRWARNVPVAYTSLSILRRKRVWWATSDGAWDIDKVQQDGFDVAFAVDTQMNAAYVRQLSRRTIDGKEDRARDGYHNGAVPFGYLPPLYPKAPDNAPSTWRPPRMPVRVNPATFPALVKIGELAATGYPDLAIAKELAGYTSTTARFGERALSKDTVAAIRRMWFPREFAPGCGHGTVETPSGELVEGRHEAAWPYELWQHIVETKAAQYRRPRAEAQRRAHEFSRIVVCATCRRQLRATAYKRLSYYRDTSAERQLSCAAGGGLSVRGPNLVNQFGHLLTSLALPDAWRDAVAERCKALHGQDDVTERVVARRAELEGEQERLVMAFSKGYLTEQVLDAQIERIRTELQTLPPPRTRSVESSTKAMLAAGETLEDMASYWEEALPEERRDIVWALLTVGGVIYDLERQAIVGLLPRGDMLPVLALGLAAQWEQRGDELWLREPFVPEKLARDARHAPSQRKLSPLQVLDAVEMVAAGTSLRNIAKVFGVSRMAVWRALRLEKTPPASATGGGA